MKMNIKTIGAAVLMALVFLFSTSVVKAATITSTAAGGTWSVTTTWVGGVVPLSTDAVVIATTGAGVVTISATTTCNSLVINSGSTLAVTRNFTVTTTTIISGTINFSSNTTTARAMTFTGDVTLNSGAVWTEPATGNGSTNTYSIRANFTNNATTFNALGTGVHTFSGSAKTISGSTITSIPRVAVTGTVTNAGTLTVGTALTGAGTLTNGNGTTGTLNIGGTVSVTTLTANAANNLVNYTGAAQTAKVTIYNNLTLSGSLAKTFATTPTVNGVLSLEGTATVTVATGVVTYGAAATLQYNKPAAYTATTKEWISPFTGTGGIIIKNAGAITTPGAVQIGNNTSVPLNINSGATLTPGANLITLHGDFINAGTLTSGSGGITIAGTVTTQSIAGFTTTGTVTLTKTAGTATLQGGVTAGALTINGSGGTLNLGTSLMHTFSGVVTLTAGTLNGGSSTLNETAVSTTAWNGTGTVFSAGTGTVNFSAAGAQTLSATATTFYNLIVSNSGIKTFTNTPTVNGVLSLEGTATATAAPTYGSAATLQYNTATSRSAGVEWVTPFAASGGVVIANTGAITMNAAKVFNSTAPLTVNSGSSLSMSTWLLTLNGDLINNGGTAGGTTGGVTISGTATQSIGAFTTTGTVSMTKTGGTATFTGNVNGAGLTINGSGGTLNLGAAQTHTFTGVVTLTAGSLNGGSSTLNENAVSTSAWNGTGSLFTPASGTVNFGGAGNQTLAASSLSFNILAFSGSGNKIFSSIAAISGNMSISGTAIADLGTFDHSSNSLTFSGTNQSSGTWGSTSSGAYHKNDTYFLSGSGTINVNCTAPNAPTSGGNHTICSGATIPALSVSVGGGETADWYSLAEGGTLLASGSLTYTPSAAGTFYAETRAGGCLSASRTGVTLVVNPNPALLSLTGSTICTSPGGNGTITSTTSVTGINYQLYNGSNAAQGAAKAGTGSGLTWTSLSAGTGYYVIGTNATTNCYSTSSTANISTNTNPAALSLTGSAICTSPGGNGFITSSTSVVGVNYQLYDGSNNPVQSAQPGTGAGLDWSNLSSGTGYYVIGTNATTSCVSPNSNTVNITSTANPVALILTGSTICASPDGNGTITSSTSQSGIDYQLFDVTDLEVGSPIAGTGFGLTWSGLTAASGYYAVGTNATTFCSSDNSNAVNVSTTPNPTITSSATAAAVCFSAGSQNTTLSYSATTNSPTNFTITWNTVAHTAGLVDVSTTSLPSSPITVPIAANVAGGTYTGTLTVTNANGCASSGHSFTVTINTQPSAPTGSSTQTLCSGATVASLSATGSGILWYAAGSGGSPLATDLTLVNGTHYYASQTVSGCESSGRLDVTATVFSSGSWMGTTSTNWFTTTNWCGGTLPTSSTNVTIAAGLSNYPSIGTTGAVCNNISIASGASLTIVGSNTLTVSGNWTHSGTFTANTSTVNFNGTGTGSVGASNFYNVTFSGAGAKSAAGALAIAGSVSITNNFTAGSYTHTVSGNWSNSGTFTATGSTIDFNGSGAGNIGAGNFNNVTFSGAGAKTATGALTIAGNVSITGNFTAGSYTHSVGGNWSKSGSFTATGSTIDFNGSGAGNIGTGNFNNVTFSGAGTKTATGILNIAGAVSITDNFSAGNYLHTVQGNWSNSGTFHANSSTISFIGTSSTINGSTSIAFNNLTLNETGGATLGIATSVAGTLTLTLGLLDIGNFNLTILSGGSISGGSATSYVKTSGSGRLKQTVPGLGSVTKNYPVGHSAYNPMAVKYNNVAVSDNFSIRVEDATITNANSSKTVNRKWFLIEDAAGTADLTLAATYNTGEGGSGFSNSSSPQVGYFDGTSWAYRPITSGSGTTTFTATGSAPDFTNTYGFFVLGSDDAFNATKLAVTNLAPANPSVGLANTTITVQSQNSQSVPTMVGTATGFNLSCTNTTMSTIPSGSIGQYTYETSVAPITFTESTLNTGTSTYDHDATVTATGTSGETLSAGTSGVFDVYESKIYEPKANGNWSTTTNWRYSTNGGSTWRDTTAVTTFTDTELIRIPLGITLTDNVTASFYSMLIYGTLDVSSSGNLTLYHSAFSDYNIHVHGTLKNSGGTLTNSDVAYPFEIHGGTYWHNMNGGSIPVCTWYTLNTTLSACKVEGTGVGGLNQSFENFTLTSGTQTLTGDMNVSAALTLTAGKIATGSYHVISGLNGTVSSAGGYINGILRRYVASTVTTGDFPVGDVNYYAPFSISCTGTPSGNGYLDVSTTAAQPPMASGLSQSKYVNRKWTISNNGVTGITAYSPSCTFADGDKVGSPATGSLKLRKLTASTWFTTNGTATGNIITATGLSTAGLTATSDFYAGEDDCSSTNAVWLGSSSTDWNTTTNWCGGSVPASTADVTIPSSPARQPVIGAAGGTCKNITIQSGASLTISGAYTLDVKGNWSNSGTFTAGTGTVSFTGSSAQTITGATIFNNLTINNTASIGEGNSRATILSEGITVNGILNLQSANASSTQGTLHTGTYTLSMLNASASVTGTGDVTGIVRRTHTFTPNVPYQFGSQYTTINFLGTGTQPGEISCKITIGSAMTGKDGSVKRYYSFARPVLESPTDQVTLNLRYLALELNGNDETETKLVIWDHHSTGTIEQHGKTNNSTSNDWVGLSGLGATYIVRTALDNRLWSLADYTTTKKMWVGVLDTDWANGGNWAPPGAPVPTDTVLIPVVGQGNYYPTFTSNVEIRSLEIAGGATVTADSYTLTINGSTGAWLNNGTFVPGTGTLILNHGNLNEIVSVSGIGTNQFHNILIGANTFIRPGTGFCMKINGGVSAQLSSIVDLSANDNTVEYNGASQTIVDPSHSGYRGYYNIIFSGTGTSTLYDGTLDISGNFTSNGTLDLSGSTVSFIGNTAQAINGTVVFNNLTINSSGGVTSSDDITVTGTLYLQSENPSSLDTGTLAMASGKILNLGVDAATTGTSDVSGIIKRTHTFATNTFYSFGNTEQGVTFPVTSGQTLPSSLSVRVTIGSTPCWGTSCIDNPANVTKRLYEFAQIGGSATKAIFRVNYKDNELAGGVNESTLSIWNRVVGTPTVIADKGWSNYDVDAEYISISDVNIALLSSTLSDFQLAIAPTSSSYKTWNGSQSTDWNTPANWTPNGVPTTSLGAIIPDDNTTVYQPTLPASGSTQATCQYLNIQTNGVLNSGGSDGATLTIVDGIVGDAWGMEAGGTFNAGNSTVIFANLNPTDVASLSGSTDFYNVTIASDSKLRPAGNSYMGIAGALVISGTFSAATNENTIEFKGGSGTQSIPNPNGGAAGYHNLILSGSGTKTLPTTLNIVDEFTNNTTAANKVDAATNSSEVIFSGIAYGQAISGTTATNFNNLTLNNSYGLTLNGVDASVDGTLTFTSGKITTDANRLILGNSASVSGAGSGKYVFGNLQRGIAAFTSTKTFEIGNSANYLPVIIDFAGTATNGTGNITCSTTDGQHPEYGSALLSEAKYLNRYWTVTNSGVTFGTYDATFTFINPDDIEGSATPALLLIKEYSGSAWSSTTSGSSSSTTVKTTNNTTFGDFVAGEALSLTTDYFRSKASGNWSSLSTWESSASGNTGTWNPASLVPDHTAHSITISGGHVVTVDATASASNLTITGTLTSGSGIALSVDGTWVNNGTFNPGTGTVTFNGTSAQTVSGNNTLNNLTINNTAGVTSTTDLTVSGVLNLSSANASSTKGALDMANDAILYMGASSTTTGTGDVSGYVNRSSFELNTDYTFGNRFTLMNFTVGPLPSSVTLEIYLTSSNISWKSDAIHRYYDVTRSGGSPATRLRFNVHYLDDELNGATEADLVLFDYHVTPDELHEHGRSDIDTGDNWVGFANVGLIFLGTTVEDDHFWTLGTSLNNETSTWIGGSPSGATDWNLPDNWDGGVPGATSHVVIPYGPASYPVLPDASMINTVDIQSEGILNATAGTPTLTITGAADAWMNHGTFRAGASTVVFTNAAATMEDPSYFNNVTIADGATLTMGINNYMGISGVLSLSSTGVLDAATNPNTVEYRGTDQTVVNPNGSTAGYYNLILSGSGVKTMPGSAMFVYGDFTLTGSASATAGAAITALGNFTIGSDNAFSTGTFNHSIGGNFENNGSFKATHGYSILLNGSLPQLISGSASILFEDLTIDNTSGVTLTNTALTTVSGTLTINSGKLFEVAAGNKLTITGTLTNSAGASGLVLHSDASGTASLIQGTDHVPATVQRYISGSAEDWHFLSSPVEDQEISGTWLPSGTYGNGTGYDLYLWDEITHCWIYKLNSSWTTVNPGTDFVPGRGYLYSTQAANPTKAFTGNLNNGEVSYGLTYAGDSLLLKGFNLVGNPYASSIDWAASSGWSRSMLTPSGDGFDMWVWNPSAGNYGVYNSADETGEGTNSVTRYIAPMQGFFVRAAEAGNLTTTNAVRVHSGANDWKNGAISTNRLSVVIESDADKTFDEALLLFGYPANQAGAGKLYSPVVTAPSLFLPYGKENLSVRYLTDTVENKRVPVMFKPGRTGDYTLTCNFDYDNFETVMLEDRQTNLQQNMKLNGSYTFKASKSDDPDRFVIHFGPDKNPSTNVLPARIYSDGTNVVIDLAMISQETEVTVCDVLGRKILQQKLQGEMLHKLYVNTDADVLIVYLYNPYGNLCRKMFRVSNW